MFEVWSLGAVVRRTLYQCFFTLPSVRVGNVFGDQKLATCKLRIRSRTFAISPQLFPASLIVFSLCSSAGLHGVLVRLFFGAGAAMGASENWPRLDSRSAGLSSSGAGMEEVPAVTEVPGALRFLDDGGLAAGCGAKGDSGG